MFSIEGFLQTLDTGFRIYKCKILLNTIILLNQIKAYLYFYWKLMLSFRHYKSWCFNRLVRAKGMKFDFCKWSWCLYKVLVAQLGPILCDSMDCNPPHSSVHAIFLARILEWIAILFLQGIFLSQESNPSFLHCRQILYHLSHQGSPTTRHSTSNHEHTWHFQSLYAERE